MKLLFVIDMQNDFLTGKLPIPNKAFPNLIPNVQKKIQLHRDMNDNCNYPTHIIYTQDTHYKDYLETEEGKKLPIPHCIKNTAGWCIDERVFPQKKDTIIEKNSFGRDWGKDFMLAPLVSNEPFFLSCIQVQYSDITDIEIIGVCTDFCVLANAFTLKALFPNVPITIDAACCAGSTPEWHEKALDILEHCHFNVINRTKGE